MKYTLEICANSIQSALAAQAGGAGRIELCQNLEQGGITPSYGLIREVKKRLSIPVLVLIRPRPGDFIYTEEEFNSIKSDIEACKKLGCEGVVTGILDKDGNVDTERCAELVNLARPMQLTFHRAFDCCADPFSALQDIIGSGFDRILTSGMADHALEGAPLLAQLVQQAGGRIAIMPGAGITVLNIREIAEITGASEFHTSAKINLNYPAKGCLPGEAEAIYYQTDEKKVSELVNLLNAL
jgi:copper homeostasis protein